MDNYPEWWNQLADRNPSTEKPIEPLLVDWAGGTVVEKPEQPKPQLYGNFEMDYTHSAYGYVSPTGWSNQALYESIATGDGSGLATGQYNGWDCAQALLEQNKELEQKLEVSEAEKTELLVANAELRLKVSAQAEELQYRQAREVEATLREDQSEEIDWSDIKNQKF